MTTKTKMNIGVTIVMSIYGATMWGMGYLTGATREATKRDQLEILKHRRTMEEWNKNNK